MSDWEGFSARVQQLGVYSVWCRCVACFFLACPSPLPLGAAVTSTPVSCMQLSALLFFVHVGGSNSLDQSDSLTSVERSKWAPMPSHGGHSGFSRRSRSECSAVTWTLTAATHSGLRC